jgi:deoxyuridine 5'-triphosphate nucleotidohydrolase
MTSYPSTTWYELEILPLDPPNLPFYPVALYNRSDGNAGFDLHASAHLSVGDDAQLIPFGIVARLLKVTRSEHENTLLKEDSHFWVLPRSSIYKTGLVMANSVGVIDKSYRGELKAPVFSRTGHSTVAHGDRLFQIVAPDMGWIRHVRIVDSLPATERGQGGFGSTGTS